MPSVLILGRGSDTAGGGIALKQAFDRYGGAWEAHVAVGRRSRWHYPLELLTSDPIGQREASRLFRDADVIHVLEDPRVLFEYPKPRTKGILVWHTGSFYRRDPAAVSVFAQRFGAIEAAGSVDLLLTPSLSFLPIVADIARFRSIRQRGYRPSKTVRIGHAPTLRALKSTDAIVAAIARLQPRLDISFDLIEGVAWPKCLQRKAALDLFVDETTLGYGANVIECWSMGIPVISGVADPAIRARMIELFGSLPFAEASEDTLEAVIEELVVDAGRRAMWAQRGREQLDRFHAPQRVVEMAIALYEQALARRGLTLTSALPYVPPQSNTARH